MYPVRQQHEQSRKQVFEEMFRIQFLHNSFERLHEPIASSQENLTNSRCPMDCPLVASTEHVEHVAIKLMRSLADKNHCTLGAGGETSVASSLS